MSGPTGGMAPVFTSAAARLRLRYPDILRTWEDRVRREVPAARHQDRLILFDEIPLFLARLVQALGGEISEEDTCLRDEVCKEHGTQRATETNYPLNGVILEYRILRKVIIEILSEDGPLTVEERESITECVEMALQDAADEFAAVQQEYFRRRSEELAEEDRRKNEFIVTLAHELRTPLSAISNAAFILASIQLDERAIRHIGAVSRQAQHVTRLVEDLLDVARIARGEVSLQWETISVEKAAMDAVQTVQPLIESRGQDLVTTFPKEAILVRADAGRLQQVLTNLLNNASKYSEAGGEIRLSVAREGSEAVLRVEDTGIGIDGIMLPQVFDLFTQVDPAAARTQGGLGIGLALVRRLVEMHGGTVTVRSEGLGRGAEFTLRLPLALEDGPDAVSGGGDLK